MVVSQGVSWPKGGSTSSGAGEQVAAQGSGMGRVVGEKGWSCAPKFCGRATGAKASLSQELQDAVAGSQDPPAVLPKQAPGLTL